MVIWCSKFPWLNITPLGLPLVPEVYIRVARFSQFWVTGCKVWFSPSAINWLKLRILRVSCSFVSSSDNNIASRIGKDSSLSRNLFSVLLSSTTSAVLPLSVKINNSSSFSAWALRTTSTPPAIIIPWSAISQRGLFSAIKPTRSPALTPNACNPAANNCIFCVNWV